MSTPIYFIGPEGQNVGKGIAETHPVTGKLLMPANATDQRPEFVKSRWDFQNEAWIDASDIEANQRVIDAYEIRPAGAVVDATTTETITAVEAEEDPLAEEPEGEPGEGAPVDGEGKGEDLEPLTGEDIVGEESSADQVVNEAHKSSRKSRKKRR